ncbi:MAG: Anaphase-promoting complex, cyclosome, subunit 3 [Pelotomaculum sp. PtaU1.Bin035]|nr:MAG: Anaphase-promoting complex, cyclosome, subunit 3 [Pelotomaculum sp. PtaU1.Bin035]
MGLKKQRIVWLLFLSLLLSGLLAGCSQNTANGDIASKLELAVKYLSENNYEEAILTYQDVIKIDAKNIIAYRGLSLAYALENNNDEAEKVLQDGLKATGQALELQLALAGFYIDAGKADQAEAIYKEMIKGSKALDAYLAYSNMLVAGGKAPNAIKTLEQAVQGNADYRLESLLADLYTKSGDKDKALEMLKKSLLSQNEQSLAYTQLSRIYSGKLDDMLALGEQMIQQVSQVTGELVKMSALYGLGKYEDLVNEYKICGDEIKNNNRARLLAAEAYSKLGMKDEASGIIKAVDTAKLKDAGILAEIADYYLDAGDKETARKLALQGIDIEESLVDNYVVMYRSYADEDKSMAQTWALKYLISSFLSYKVSLAQLAGNGLELSFVKLSEDELTSKEIVAAIVVDQAHAEKILKSNPDWPQIHSFVYLDTKHNIAYKGYAEKVNNWKPLIERYHLPAIYTKETIPEDVIDGMKRRNSVIWNDYLQRGEFSRYILGKNRGTPTGKIIDWAFPIVLEGDITFEEHLKRAGYPIENINFIDIFN